MSRTSSLAFSPPTFVIDLALPPRERYKHVARAYLDHLKGLTELFNQLLLDLLIPPQFLGLVNNLSKLLLRRMHTTEQTEELEGIRDVTAIPMYLLIAYNVVLDLLMGCTSGVVQSLEPGQLPSQAKMLHFRTLDWGMNPLRDVVVQLDFVDSTFRHPTQVLATSLTYAGFTGVLTGVRPGLSLSLNFRALHDASTKWEHVRFYFNHLMVLTGRRQSIAHLLRSYLIGSAGKAPKKDWTLDSITVDLLQKHTTAAYLIFCDGDSALVVEKDYADAKVRSSKTFIIATNHDVADHSRHKEPLPTVLELSSGARHQQPTDIAEVIAKPLSDFESFLQDSEERMICVERKWQRKVNAAQRERPDLSRTEIEQDVFLSKRQVTDWVKAWPTSNESTHYAVVLDAKVGKVAWAKAYPVPLEKAKR